MSHKSKDDGPALDNPIVVEEGGFIQDHDFGDEDEFKEDLKAIQEAIGLPSAPRPPQVYVGCAFTDTEFNAISRIMAGAIVTLFPQLFFKGEISPAVKEMFTELAVA